MKYNYLMADPSGNTTAFVWADFAPDRRAAAARRVMDVLRVEQVAFVHGGRMDMMGGEFCGNASRSFALVQALYRGEGVFSALREPRVETVAVSGADHPLEVTLRRKDGRLWAAVEMPLPTAILPLEDAVLGRCTLVQYPGISHFMLENIPWQEAHLSAARRLLRRNVPPGPARDCFGLLYVHSGRMRPLVCVEATRTRVWESSCASGTCAVAAAQAFSAKATADLELFQPGGSLTTKAEWREGRLAALMLEGPVDFPAHGSIDL